MSITTSNSASEGVEHTRRLVVVEHALAPTSRDFDIKVFSIISGNILVSNPGSANASKSY
jgi:hypothetical protein